MVEHRVVRAVICPWHATARNCTLAHRNVPQGHTIGNLCAFLQSTCAERDLPAPAFTVMDNVQNFVATVMRCKSWTRVPCFAPTLQLCTGDTLHTGKITCWVLEAQPPSVITFADSTSRRGMCTTGTNPRRAHQMEQQVHYDFMFLRAVYYNITACCWKRQYRQFQWQ